MRRRRAKMARLRSTLNRSLCQFDTRIWFPKVYQMAAEKYSLEGKFVHFIPENSE